MNSVSQSADSSSATLGHSFSMTDLRRSAELRLHPASRLISVVVLLMLAVPVQAQTQAATRDPGLPFLDAQRRYFFGDWGGKRSALAEKGVTFDFFYISDMQANPSGGLQQTQAGWERVRGTVDINFDHLIQWQGLSFHATGLWQGGVNLGGKIGTLANPSALVSAQLR